MFWLHKAAIIVYQKMQKENYIAIAIHIIKESQPQISMIIRTAIVVARQWLLYVVKTSSCFGFAIIQVLYRQIMSLLLHIIQTQWDVTP